MSAALQCRNGPTNSRVQPFDERIRQNRTALPTPHCFTTSPKGAAAIIRTGQVGRLRCCKTHGLSQPDADLVAWLVEQHLVMSATAQKQDLSDPEVLRSFVQRVDDERHLVALYLLTVADIRGTSPKVWNAWKAKLLEDLFHATRRMLTGERSGRQDGQRGRQEDAMVRLRL